MPRQWVKGKALVLDTFDRSTQQILTNGSVGSEERSGQAARAIPPFGGLRSRFTWI